MENTRKKIWLFFEKTIRKILIEWLHLRILEQKWDSFMQFVKFGIVGVSNTLSSYISYLVFIGLGCHYILASVLSFVVSVTNSFYWNNKYVFKEGAGKSRPLLKTYARTFLAYASTGLILANILLVLWVDVVGINEVVAPLINLIVTIPLNFMINKYWAFE